MSRLCGVLARSEVIFVENRNFSPTRVLDGRVGSGRVIILLTFLCGLGSTVFFKYWPVTDGRTDSGSQHTHAMHLRRAR